MKCDARMRRKKKLSGRMQLANEPMENHLENESDLCRMIYAPSVFVSLALGIKKFFLNLVIGWGFC